MRFSILICSRARSDILETNVTNIFSLADHPEEVEVLIGADTDDLATQETAKELQAQFDNIHLIIQDRVKNLHTFNNLLAIKAKGKYLFILNDDSLLEIFGWDSDFEQQIETSLAPYKDRIAQFGLTSNSSDRIGEYSEFFIVTKEAYQALGFFLFEETRSWGCDNVLNRIYSSVNRAFKIKTDRPLRHLFHENGTQPNENRAFMEGVFMEQYGNSWGEAIQNMQKHLNSIDLSPYTKKLADAIGAVA